MCLTAEWIMKCSCNLTKMEEIKVFQNIFSFLFNSKHRFSLLTIPNSYTRCCFVHCFNNIHVVLLTFFLKLWFITWRKKIIRRLFKGLPNSHFPPYWGTCFFPFPFVSGECNRRLFSHRLNSASTCSGFYNFLLTLKDVEDCSLSPEVFICLPEAHSSSSIRNT